MPFRTAEAMPSAAFHSRSSQRTVAAASEAPDAGDYDPYGSSTMAAKAARTTGRKSAGSFGSSVRELTWGKQGAARQAQEAPSSAETAPVPTSFGSKSRRPPKAPSASMGGGSRFGPQKEASVGDFYVPPSLGSAKSQSSSRRTSTLGTMGSSKRFNEVKVCAPGDYSDARPGAFSSGSKQRGKQNTGFGGTSSRVTAFGEAAKKSADNASAHLTYDVNTSAFAKATTTTGVSSAAFASKSTQRLVAPVPEGPSAQAYNTASVGSLAAGANKSFNKSVRQGTGGFGTSARRSSEMLSARNADVPGPGEYAPDENDAPRAQSARPSSAFASTTRKDVVRKSDAPSAVDYDAHKTDGMAAVATHTFNKSGAYGARAERKTHDTKDTPGPGEYVHNDPSRPTVVSGMHASKNKVSGAFASTTLREVQWNANGGQGAFSNFLP